MIKLIIVMILSTLAVVWVFPKWSKERDKRLAMRSYFTCWTAREIMLFIAWLVITSVCILSLLSVVVIFMTGGFE